MTLPACSSEIHVKKTHHFISNNLLFCEVKHNNNTACMTRPNNYQEESLNRHIVVLLSNSSLFWQEW